MTNKSSLCIKPGYYQHYKGNIYYVEGVTHRDTETLDWLVTYSKPSDDHKWARPFHKFTECRYDPETGGGLSRFKFLGDDYKSVAE